MSKYTAVYKCRFCEELDEVSGLPDVDPDDLYHRLRILPQYNKVEIPSTSTYATDRFSPPLVAVHRCSGGNIGLADLVGFFKEGDVE